MTDSAQPRMTFTGERFIPREGGARIAYEHYHRYFLARRVASGKSVLDLGCGEGYGSNLLAEVASRVVGVDLSPQAIEHARIRYQRPNLNFEVSDCRKTGFPDGGFDLIVCFEMIEHIEEHHQLLSEVKRLLRPGGCFVVSSPDKAVYSDAQGYENPFHVKELYAGEFRSLLEKNFALVKIFSQNLCLGSVLHPLPSLKPAGQPQAELIEVKANSENILTAIDPVGTGAKYYIGVCSQMALDPLVESLSLSVWNDTSETMVCELEQALRTAQSSLEWLNSQKLLLEEMLKDRDHQVLERDGALSVKTEQAAELRRMLTGRESEIAARNEEILSKDLLVTELTVQTEQLKDFENQMKGTFIWRVYHSLPEAIRRWLKRRLTES
jgi:protein-L-isoaspartate O-methyltransferase